MGKDEEGKVSKTDKSSSPVPQDQTTHVHPYPDWAAMQAYYGTRVAMTPYYNSAMAPGHPPPPPYMWGHPQPMMPPYGVPYAALYPHGGVYAHPGVPMGPQSQGQVVPSPTAATIPVGMVTPTKSSGNTDQGLMKKLREFDGLAMSIGNGNGNTESADDGVNQKLSQSTYGDGTSEGSDGNTAMPNKSKRKRSREGTPVNGIGVMCVKQSNSSMELNAYATSDKGLGTSVSPTSIGGRPVLSSGIATSMEVRNNSNVSLKTNHSSASPRSPVMPSEAWLQNERELKREKRKQSNRESARRSRLRRQAEAEELARKVESLMGENAALKSEMTQITEKSKKLRLENAMIMEKLKHSQLGHRDEMVSINGDDKSGIHVNTENLLSRVNNSGPVERNSDKQGEMYENNPKSGAKLRQLLDTSSRADAVAAG